MKHNRKSAGPNSLNWLSPRRKRSRLTRIVLSIAVFGLFVAYVLSNRPITVQKPAPEATLREASPARSLAEATPVVAQPAPVALTVKPVEPSEVNHPPVPASPKLERAHASLKLRTTTLLGSDPNGDVLSLADIDTTSANGGSVTHKDGWIFYQAPEGLTGDDTIHYTVRDEHGALASGTVTIAVMPSPAEANAKVISSTSVSSAAVRIADSGIPGRTYTIEFADDPAAPVWQALGTTIADASGAYEFLDRNSDSSKRIYRARTF